MESYHDYLEHRSHKYIKRERTKSGKYRYWYPPKNNDPRLSKTFSDRISEKMPKITIVSKGNKIDGVAANGKMFIDNLLDKMPKITIVKKERK